MEAISYYHHYVLSPEYILSMLLLKFLILSYFPFDIRFFEFSCVRHASANRFTLPYASKSLHGDAQSVSNVIKSYYYIREHANEK